MNILFLCIGNSCRSIIAENLFNKYSKKFKSILAGKKPSTKIVGINKKYDIDITMGCLNGCPTVQTKKLIAWNIDDCKGKEIEKVREIRDEIDKKIKELIKEVEQ